MVYTVFCTETSPPGSERQLTRRPEGEKSTLRQQARAWLRADLDGYAKRLRDEKAAAIVQIEDRLIHWQEDVDLAGMRTAKDRAGLPGDEAGAWQKLWADVTGLLKAAAGRFIETRLDGALSAQDKTRPTTWKMIAGRTYVIDMESTALDSFLKLLDPNGKLLADNDDIVPDVNLNARLIFTTPADGVYRILATSFEQRGVGPYVLRVREFKDAK